MTRNGHKPTEYTKEEMPSILSQPQYDILVNLGRGWQNKEYENINTGNVFQGEPSTGQITPFVFGFEDKGLKWGITYSFDGLRVNYFASTTGKAVKYGADNMDMDRLYYILVNAFNFGEDFIQRYLNEVAPIHLGSEIKGIVEPALEEFRRKVLLQEERNEERLNEAVELEEMLEKAETHRTKATGEIDKRYRYKGERLYDVVSSLKERLAKFYEDIDNDRFTIKGKSWRKESEEVAELLRQDFVNSMNTGIVPLAKSFLSSKTVEIRNRLGFGSEPIFVASSQFVNSIQFKVRIKNG